MHVFQNADWVNLLQLVKKTLKFYQVTAANYFLNLHLPILFVSIFQKGNFNLQGVSVHPYLVP